MIFHPGRTDSCIMPPRRAVSCVLKLNPPARIGKNLFVGHASKKTVRWTWSKNGLLDLDMDDQISY